MAYRGYIFSRTFMEERVPQHVQNLVIRDYCTIKQLDYLLHVTEYGAEPICVNKPAADAVFIK